MQPPGSSLLHSTTEAAEEVCPAISAKQHAILDAATTVFLREGYERASVDTIAAEAGVSKRTIYNHFRDKKELFITVVERARARANAITPADPNILTDARLLDTELVVVGERLLAFQLDPDSAALRRVIVSEVKHDPTLGPACMEGTPKTILHGLADRFAKLAAEGALDIEDSMLAARQFAALVMFEGEKKSAYGTLPLSEDVRHTIAVNAARFFLRAYRTRDTA
jgi:TetR/AcrR family transcriptional regulator, mexJK operon transcriptional repressor